MSALVQSVSGGFWLLLAMGVCSGSGHGAEKLGRAVAEEVSPIATAYRQLGDIYRDGRLPREKARFVQAFLDEVRLTAPGSASVAVVDPSKLVTDQKTDPDGPRAASAYQVAGGLGDPEALVRLGELYREGRVVPKNPGAAFVYFSKARDLGYASARWRLAEMMLRGEGTAIDRKGAQAELQVAAEAGVSTAMLMLGDLRATGALGPVDPEAAVSVWQQAVAAGDVRGLVRLASLYDDGELVSRDAANAYRLYDEAGSKGDTYAAVRAARMLLLGDGVAADRERAVARLEALGAAGGAEGKIALADFYASRDQSKENFDLQRAYGLYGAAAQLGSRSAQLRMALMQVHGEGTPANPAAGIATLQTMAQDGHAPAAYSLGDLFSLGPAHLSDPAGAVAAYGHALETGDRRAAVRLGDLFSNGDLVPRDPKKALTYYQIAARHDDSAARLKAEELVVRDLGTQQEARAAFENIQRMAANGLTEAMVLVADLTRVGLAGVIAANEAKALESYLAAANKGSKVATLRAGEILITGAEHHRDLPRGVALMQSIANGDASAYLALGDALLKAGVDDYVEQITATEAFERAGAAGHSLAYLRLGDLYRDGTGVAVDGAKAAHYYMQAAGLQPSGDRVDAP